MLCVYYDMCLLLLDKYYYAMSYYGLVDIFACYVSWYIE